MQASQFSELEKLYEVAALALQSGRYSEVEACLASHLAKPDCPAQLLALAGFSRLRSGEPARAITLLERASSAEPTSLVYKIALGDALLADDQAKDAERVFRDAIAQPPYSAQAHIGLARALFIGGNKVEARDVLRARISQGERDPDLLAVCASIEHELGDLEANLSIQTLAAQTYPDSAAAQHNLAAAYGDLHLYREALEAAKRSLRLGVQDPRSWLVRARALQGLGRIEEAKAAFEEAIQRAPAYAEAHRDYAQLLWMVTGDPDEAGRALRRAISAQPTHGGLAMALAKLLQFVGDLEGARAALNAHNVASPEPSLPILLLAGELAVDMGDLDAALKWTDMALGLAPEFGPAIIARTDALGAVGRPEEGLALLSPFSEQNPDDQNAIARIATLCRLVGDPRARAYFDYESLVKSYVISAPETWPSLALYLADLQRALVAKHLFRQHPFDQSLRNGGQIPLNLARETTPEIVAFAKAIDAPIRHHIQALNRNAAPGARRSDGYRIDGAWSVWLRPDGYHHNHLHPKGWLSSAFYVEIPEEEADNPKAGWIQFGEPGVPTSPRLQAEYFIKPEPGKLVIFPSYMWHGTVPFRSQGRRLTLAFDATAPRLVES